MINRHLSPHFPCRQSNKNAEFVDKDNKFLYSDQQETHVFLHQQVKSPDWSKIPFHCRPFQGPERPLEFDTSLQETWLRNKTPDVTTPLAKMIYSEEINSRQMWEVNKYSMMRTESSYHVFFQISESLELTLYTLNEINQNPDLPPIEVIIPEKVREKMEEMKDKGIPTDNGSLDNSLCPPLEFVYTERLKIQYQYLHLTFIMLMYYCLLGLYIELKKSH